MNNALQEFFSAWFDLIGSDAVTSKELLRRIADSHCKRDPRARTLRTLARRHFNLKARSVGRFLAQRAGEQHGRYRLERYQDMSGRISAWALVDVGAEAAAPDREFDPDEELDGFGPKHRPRTPEGTLRYAGAKDSAPVRAAKRDAQRAAERRKREAERDLAEANERAVTAIQEAEAAIQRRREARAREHITCVQPAYGGFRDPQRAERLLQQFVGAGFAADLIWLAGGRQAILIGADHDTVRLKETALRLGLFVREERREALRRTKELPPVAPALGYRPEDKFISRATGSSEPASGPIPMRSLKSWSPFDA